MASAYSKRGVWYANLRDETGKRVNLATKARTKTEAKRFASELEHQAERVRLGLQAATPADGGGTLGDLFEWWLKTYRVGQPAYVTDESAIRCHFSGTDLAALPLVAVTPGRLETFLQAKSKDLSPQTINHLRGYVSRAFGAAKKAGKWAGLNPADNVSRRKVPTRMPDYLKAHEVGPVMEQLAERWRPLFAAALYTGMRKGELLGLRKADVDLEAGIITVNRSYDRDTTKGGHADRIPVAAELFAYLKVAMALSPSNLVFPDPKGRMMSKEVNLEHVLRRALARAGIVEGYRHVCRKKGCEHAQEASTDALLRCPVHGHKLWPVAKIRPIRFHDLRHTTASLLMQAGANPAAVQRILRHADPKTTTSIYGHLAPGYLKSEVDLLAFGLIAPNMPPVIEVEGRTVSSEILGPFSTRLLPGPQGTKEKTGNPSDIHEELPAVELERETGFEPATLSLGS